MIVQGRGRFGPFVKHGKLYANIPKAEDPATVTFERAVELVEAKMAGARQNILKEFEGSEIQILGWPLWTVHHRRQQERQPAQGYQGRGPELGTSHRIAGGRPRTQRGQVAQKRASGSTRQGSSQEVRSQEVRTQESCRQKDRTQVRTQEGCG
jgi:hypothetical protein